MAPPPPPDQPQVGPSDGPPQVQGGPESVCVAIGHRVYRNTGEPSFLDMPQSAFEARVVALTPTVRAVSRPDANARYSLQCRPGTAGEGTYCTTNDFAEIWLFRGAEFQYLNMRLGRLPGSTVAFSFAAGVCS